MIRLGFIPKFAPNGSMSLMAASVYRHRDLIRDEGIDLRLNATEDVDAVSVHKDACTIELRNSGVPLLIDETRDAAQVSPVIRKWLNERDSIAGVLKPHVYAPRQLYFHEEWPVGFHHTVMRRFRSDFYERAPQNTGVEFDAAKLHCTIGYSCYERLDSLRDAKVPDWKPTDVHFAGCTDYTSPPVQSYRRLCVDAVKSLKGCRAESFSAHSCFPHTRYYQTLLRTKICVSPWGWGVACHRDVEAILAGCVVVKPTSNFIEAWPDIYRGDRLVTCLPDFSDLQRVVDEVLGDWKAWQGRCAETREWLINETQPIDIAYRYAGVIKRCLRTST